MLLEISAEVIDSLHAEAVVLYGSFSRGEGGVFWRDDKLHVDNDFDLLVIYEGAAQLLRTLANRRRAEALGEELQLRYPVKQIDVAARPGVSLRRPRPTLEHYELLQSARVLMGKTRLPPAGSVRLDQLPPVEFSRLLFNRGAGLLVAWCFLQYGRPEEADSLRTPAIETDKAFLACGDALLFLRGQYHHLLSSRIEAISAAPIPAGWQPDLLRREYLRSASTKLLPTGDPPTRDVIEQRWESAVDSWLSAYDVYETGRSPWSGGWTRYPGWTTGPTWRRGLQAVRSRVRHMPSPRAMTVALPLLLMATRQEGALDGDHYKALTRALRVRDDRPSLAALVRMFLNAWHPSGAALRAAQLAAGQEG